MKCNKSVHRARLADNPLHEILRITVSAFDANIEELSSGKQAQVSHWMTPERFNTVAKSCNDSVLHRSIYYKIKN